MSKIAVIGSYNQDMVFRTNRIPGVGETVQGTGFFSSSGGKGSNQAIAAHIQGANVTPIIKLGKDAQGEEAQALYRKLGLPLYGILLDENAHTGVAGIFSDEDGSNSIIVSGGSNLTLSSDEILAAVPQDIRLAGFQLENAPDEIFKAIRALHENGVDILLDPAPVVMLPEWLYPCLTYLKPNEYEAAALSGCSIENQSDAQRAADALLKKGVKNVIITLGNKGCVVRGTVNTYVPAPKVQAVDTTGAGDIFSGTLLAMLSRSEGLEEAIRLASCAAALSVTKLGVWQACPTEAETRNFARQLGW